MPGSPNSPLQIQASTLDQLRRFAAGGYLYAILDACDAPEITSKIQELGDEKAVCLFLTQSDRQYWQWPPYLIAVDDAALDWIVSTLAHLPWGTFVFSKSGLETLRTHLRRFLILQLLDGERWFFRFYDPRLLKGHLENCRPAEIELFFGPVRAFGIIGPGANEVALYHIESQRASSTERGFLDSRRLQTQRQTAAAFEKASEKEFEENMIHFVNNAFPARCKALGDAAVRERIRHGYDRAADYQFTREKDRSRFIELLFMLGQNFDRNPNLAWVQAILHDPSIADPSARMERLWHAAAEIISQNTFIGGK